MQMRRVILLTIVLTATACRSAGPVVRCHTSGGSVDVAVEVVDTDETRARGLMYRNALADGAGMLFVFDEEAEHSFWMKNTLIPLDMIFIAGDRTIAGIHENAHPLSLDPITVGKPSRYVLEVPGGWSSKNALKAGDRVEMLGLPGSHGWVSQRDVSEVRAVESVAALRRATVVAVDESIALGAADIALKHDLAMADAIVYATANRHHAKLVTADTDFEGLPGVTIIRSQR